MNSLAHYTETVGGGRGAGGEPYMHHLATLR